MAKPTTKALLKEILSDDIERVYVHITGKAVEWAVAGFIDEANNLLEQLWKFKIPHSGNLRSENEGLQVLWAVSNKQPSYIPFEFKDTRQIEQENWSGFFFPSVNETWYREIRKRPFEELSGDELLYKAVNSVYENTGEVQDILKALDRFLSSDNAVGYTFYKAASCGALLAARNDLTEQADHFVKLWGEGYLKYWSNYRLSDLMRDREIARLCLKGILAPVFKLTKEICDQETKQIIDVLRKRMAGSRTLVYGNLSWTELLNRISKLAIAQKTIDFADDILKNETLSRPSSTDAEIKAAENKLNIIFPEDYRKFLLTSNGFECFSSTGATLSPVDKVDFLKNIDRELLDIWTDSMNGIDNDFCDKFRNSIVIGGLDEEQQLLLIPLPNNKWECWHFSSWRPGEVVYESFRFYMEGELQRLEDDFYIG